MLSGLLCHLCLAGPSLCSPCANPAAPCSPSVPCWGALIPVHCPLSPIPTGLPSCTHADPQRFPLLVMCSHFGASIRLVLEGKVNFAFSVSARGMVHCILMEEIMCQVLLSSPLVLLGHTHVVLVLFLLNTFSHSRTSQKLCNFLLFSCILQPLTTTTSSPPPHPPTPKQNRTKHQRKRTLSYNFWSKTFNRACCDLTSIYTDGVPAIRFSGQTNSTLQLSSACS